MTCDITVCKRAAMTIASKINELAIRNSNPGDVPGVLGHEINMLNRDIRTLEDDCGVSLEKSKKAITFMKEQTESLMPGLSTVGTSNLLERIKYDVYNADSKCRYHKEDIEIVKHVIGENTIDKYAVRKPEMK